MANCAVWPGPGWSTKRWPLQSTTSSSLTNRVLSSSHSRRVEKLRKSKSAVKSTKIKWFSQKLRTWRRRLSLILISKDCILRASLAMRRRDLWHLCRPSLTGRHQPLREKTRWRNCRNLTLSLGRVRANRSNWSSLWYLHRGKIHRINWLGVARYWRDL